MNSPENILNTSPLFYLVLIFCTVATAALITVILFRARARRRLAAGMRSITQSPDATLDTVFPDSKFVTVMGINIRYVERGDRARPTVVLIHGFSGYIYCWRFLLEDLAKDFHVVAFDLPGFGRSDKLVDIEYGLDHQTERIFKFLDAVNVERFHLVGHSMGGGISAWMAKSRPERVKNLMLIAPAVGTGLVRFNPAMLSWAVPMMSRAMITPAYFRRVYLSVSGIPNMERLDEDLRHYYSPYASDAGAAVTSYKHLHLLRDKRLGNELRDLAMPLLVLAGGKDRVVSVKYLQGFLKLNPKAELVVHPDAGHLLYEECPDFVIAHLRRFLQA